MLLTKQPSRPNVQNPQCEGKYTNRTLFDSRILPSRQRLFSVDYLNQPTTSNFGGYIVHAGFIHKITPHSKFSLFRKSDVDLADQIGTLSVAESTIGRFSSPAKVSFTSPIQPETPIVALQTKIGREDDLRVYIPPSNSFLDIYQELKKKHDLDDVSTVRSLEDADMVAEKVSNNKITFTMRTIKHTKLPRYEWPQTVKFDASKPAEIAKILSSASHFYRELKCNDQQSASKKILNDIEISFHTLKYQAELGDWDQPEFVPDDPCVNLYDNGIISIRHDPKAMYGLKLVNRSKSDLYPTIFLFDNRSLEISQSSLSIHLRYVLLTSSFMHYISFLK